MVNLAQPILRHADTHTLTALITSRQASAAAAVAAAVTVKALQRKPERLGCLLLILAFQLHAFSCLYSFHGLYL